MHRGVAVVAHGEIDQAERCGHSAHHRQSHSPAATASAAATRRGAAHRQQKRYPSKRTDAGLDSLPYCYNITFAESSRSACSTSQSANRFLIGPDFARRPSWHHVQTIAALPRPCPPLSPARQRRGVAAASMIDGSRSRACRRCRRPLGRRTVHLARLQLLPAGRRLSRLARQATRHRRALIPCRLLGLYRLEGPLRLARHHRPAARLRAGTEAALCLHAGNGGRRNRRRYRPGIGHRRLAGAGDAALAPARHAGPVARRQRRPHHQARGP